MLDIQYLYLVPLSISVISEICESQAHTKEYFILHVYNTNKVLGTATVYKLFISFQDWVL